MQHPAIEKLPKEWEINRVDALFSIQQGKQVSKKNRVGDNQLPFLRTRNIFWGRLDLSELDRMHFSDQDEQRLSLKLNDLLVCEGGDVGRTAIWQNEVQNCYYQNHLHRLRAINPNSIRPEYALYWFWYAFQIGKIYFGRSNVTTIPNLSKSRLGELPIPKPPLPEQRKIAYILSTVQQAIEQQERLIALTTELKKTLMHKLFTEGLRGEPQKDTEIGPVPESWEVVTFENFSETFQYGTSVKCDYNIKGKPVLRIPNVVGGNVDFGDMKFGNPKPNEIEKLKLQYGDLLFVRTNGVKENAGRCSMYRNEIEECYFASYLIRVQVKQDILNPEFIEEYTRTEQGQSFLSGKAIRTADGKFNINAGILKRMLIPVPQKNEQDEIAHQLKLLDRKRTIQEKKKRVLSDLFRTLLYQLMTAQIRVHELEFEEG